MAIRVEWSELDWLPLTPGLENIELVHQGRQLHAMRSTLAGDREQFVILEWESMKGLPVCVILGQYADSEVFFNVQVEDQDIHSGLAGTDEIAHDRLRAEVEWALLAVKYVALGRPLVVNAEVLHRVQHSPLDELLDGV